MLMALGLIAFSAAEGHAQYRDRDYNQDRRDDRRDDRYDRNGNSRREMYRVAQQNGFRDGQAQGRDDRRDRDRYNPQKAKDYKRATNGYDSRWRDKDDYKRAYRQAFIEGYNQSYNRGGRRGGNNNGWE